MDVQFDLANSMIICGPCKAGKTSFVMKLLKHRHVVFQEPINKIYWFYGAWQKAYEEAPKEVVFKSDLD